MLQPSNIPITEFGSQPSNGVKELNGRQFLIPVGLEVDPAARRLFAFKAYHASTCKSCYYVIIAMACPWPKSGSLFSGRLYYFFDVFKQSKMTFVMMMLESTGFNVFLQGKSEIFCCIYFIHCT